MNLDNDYFYPHHTPRLVSVVSDCCVEQVAASLEALAVELDREAQYDGVASTGLSLAAMVLRDRAVETLNGNLDLLTSV